MTTPAPRPPAVKLAWRIGLPKFETDREFERLLRFLRQHRGAVDELALFETVTHHLYLPLDEVLVPRAALMGRRLDALRAAGFASVGINVLCSIGHANEAWDYVAPLPFQAMIGHTGAVSRGCGCPNAPALRAYIRAKYALFAQANPDFIWVDDDIRMHHHGVSHGCFCPVCLDRFERSTGVAYSREALARALNEPAEAPLRQAWVEQNIRTLEELLAEIAGSIAAVNPRIALGLMTAGPAWTTYSGQAFERWFPALQAVKARPGGGFYSDAARLGLPLKAVEVGRQRAQLPTSVTDIQYELENFPYQALQKSTGSALHECTLALAMGHNGIAFNALGGEGSDDEFHGIPAGAERLRPFWNRLLRQVADLPTVGFWVAWSPELTARRQLRPGEDWFGGDGRYDINKPQPLAEIGLPLGVDRAAASGVVLNGRVAEAFSTHELEQMLAGAVFMDSAALEVLSERGLGALTGVRVKRHLDNGLRERFSSDPLNGRFADDVRDARIEFWGDARGLADELEPLAPTVRVLASLETYFGQPRLGPCMTVYENDRGGRVAVAGYAPWMFVHSLPKRTQLQNVLDWLTRDTLPVRIEETVPLIPIVRLNATRERGAVVLLNAGLDPIPQATLQVRAPDAAVRLLLPNGSTRRLQPRPVPGGWTVTLGPLPAWSTAVLLIG
jgi:hypothetical protein